MSKKNGGVPLHAQISVLINASQLGALLKHARSTGKQVAELTGSHREKIAYAKDKHGLHTKAFAMVKALDRMESEAVLECMTHFEAYMEMSGIKARMESVTRLDLDSSEPGGKPGKVALLAHKRKEREEAQQEAAE